MKNFLLSRLFIGICKEGVYPLFKHVRGKVE